MPYKNISSKFNKISFRNRFGLSTNENESPVISSTVDLCFFDAVWMAFCRDIKMSIYKCCDISSLVWIEYIAVWIDSID